MQLWTHHTKELQIDAPDVKIDPTLGQYWNDPEEHRRIRYREILGRFQDLIGTKQILWCCTKRGMYSDLKEELIEWELNIPNYSKIRLFKT